MLNTFHEVISWNVICGNENLVHIRITSITKANSISELAFAFCLVLMILRVATPTHTFLIFRHAVDICMDTLRMSKYHHTVTESKFQRMMHLLFSTLAEGLLIMIS